MRNPQLIVVVFSLFLITGYYFAFIKNKGTAKVRVGEQTLRVEIADTEPARAKGLMFREKLDSDGGMLFVFDFPAPHSFWMGNTKIPLDIIWVGENMEVVDINSNTPPCSEANPVRCPTYKPEKPALYVVETNGGWTEEKGIKVGDKVTIENV